MVRQVKDKPPRGITLKEIGLVRNDIGIREEELSFFERLAHDLAQSISSVLYAALPTPPIRPSRGRASDLAWLPLPLPSSEAEHVLRIVQTLAARGQAFVQTPDLRRAAAVILAMIFDNTMFSATPCVYEERHPRHSPANASSWNPLMRPKPGGPDRIATSFHFSYRFRMSRGALARCRSTRRCSKTCHMP